jgi:DNA repair exonuclease SbcCD ATPase subunit
MLDALKTLTSGKNKLVQKQAEELEQLITTAREERGAIGAMLTALTASTAKLAPLGKTLEQVSEMTAGVASRLDEITRRLTSLDDRTRELADLDTRIASLRDAALQAEQTTQRAIGPDGELRAHRAAVEHLSSQALGAEATLAALKSEHATLEELRGQLQTSESETSQALTQSSTLRAELEQVRAVAAALTQDYATIRASSRNAREDTTAALTTVTEVENKVAGLARLHELSQTTEARLTALNALAEHVAHKAKALDSQQQSVEHAVVQANRVNEMVWAMDVQIGKLGEGMKQVARFDETLARTEKLTAETGSQLEAASRLRVETENETASLKREAASLLDAVRGQVDTLSLKKKELDALDLRLGTLQSGVGDAEARMEALTAKERSLTDLGQRIDAMSVRIEALTASADNMTEKQVALESLNDRLGEVDALTKQTSWQLDALRESRRDVEALRQEITEFYQARAEAAKLADALGASRAGLEAVGDRLTAFSAAAPELEARMDAILGKLALVDAGTLQAARLHDTVAALDAQISRVGMRVPFVEQFESRLNGLNALSADVDRRLEEQLASRGGLDTLKAQCEGQTAQVADAHHKLCL